MSVSRDRCGHVPDGSEVEALGAACCWRPVWEGRPRCIWHSTTPEKPREELERHRPGPGERLDGAVLRGTNLSRTDWFAECVLVGADFTGATCVDADFSDADLRWARFGDCNLTRTGFEGANLEDATFVRADLRGADFRGTRLYRAVYADAHVDSGTRFDDRLVYETEMERADDDRLTVERGEAAAWTYQRLQNLFAENTLARRSHRYYIRARDVRRRLAWTQGEASHALKLEGSRWVMRYGVSPWRVLAVSALLILVSALLYPLTGGIQEIADGSTITYFIRDPTSPAPTYLARVYGKSLYFSVVTFATLGYGDIQPIGGWARAIAGVESILGSLLIALLVFVLTRSVG